ncbi:isopentenyl-diphosphate Delta-isomerase [Streptomyces sp. M41]|uniref:isopentenyl-diphosphate Delta-isomerase n=1 Tax=Streptomyces sp. M41 TaxID=3059412 RepID=UPI00142724E8|nr:IPP isomerase [Streptomyces sp.]BDC78264.1 isopentenyl diphosphate isomerase [Streptomyces viridochromogenes]
MTSVQATGTTTEPILLELVDDDGRTIGVAEKLSAHQAPGRLHRAFSVFLFDSDGRMLLQQRAHTKYHSPGVWSNTCCGHPYPDEPPHVAAARRVREELGLENLSLEAAGTVTYEHPDDISGLVEKEYNHLFVGVVDEKPEPDPAEVGDFRYVNRAELDDLRGQEPFSAWFMTVLNAATPGMVRVAPGGGW